MARANLFILLPRIRTAENNPFYQKSYLAVTQESVKSVAVAISDVECFFDYEEYDSYYDGRDLAHIVTQIEQKEDEYLGMATLLMDALKGSDNWRDDIQQGNEKFCFKGRRIADDSLCEMTARQEADPVSTFCILNKREFTEKSDCVTVSIYDKSHVFSCLDISVRNLASWLEMNRRPMREYHWNKKHGENGTGAQPQQKGASVSILYCSRDEAAQMLNKAVGRLGESRLFWYDEKHEKYMVFMRESAHRYHSFHVDDSNAVPADIRKKICKIKG